jgi:hypothetical protein
LRHPGAILTPGADKTAARSPRRRRPGVIADQATQPPPPFIGVWSGTLSSPELFCDYVWMVTEAGADPRAGHVLVTSRTLGEHSGEF